jgi:hypothetical protein
MAKKMTRQQHKFAAISRACHSKMRAGKLPRKGDFGKCMRSGFKKR